MQNLRKSRPGRQVPARGRGASETMEQSAPAHASFRRLGSGGDASLAPAAPEWRMEQPSPAQGPPYSAEQAACGILISQGGVSRHDPTLKPAGSAGTLWPLQCSEPAATQEVPPLDRTEQAPGDWSFATTSQAARKNRPGQQSSGLLSILDLHPQRRRQPQVSNSCNKLLDAALQMPY